MFTLTTASGEISGDICDVLAAAEAGQLVSLPAAPHFARHGVVANIGALVAVLRAYSDRSTPWTADDWRSEWDAQLGAKTREFRCPLGEPALFQRSASPGAKVDEIQSAEIGPSPLRGIVTLIKNWPNLVLLREAKSLKMHVATTGESPQFRCKSD